MLFILLFLYSDFFCFFLKVQGLGDASAVQSKNTTHPTTTTAIIKKILVHLKIKKNKKIFYIFEPVQDDYLEPKNLLKLELKLLL